MIPKILSILFKIVLDFQEDWKWNRFELVLCYIAIMQNVPRFSI